MLNGHKILWEHLYKFLQFDQQNPVPLNRYLSEAHFSLTSVSKMRNYLADQVLNHEMVRIAEVNMIIFFHKVLWGIQSVNGC